MNPPINHIEFGDCRDIMRRWASQGVKVQTCITSPPYFGLRDYGVDGQLGLEQTPDEYITNQVEVFRCVRDILKDDGTLWLNLGDSYVSSPTGNSTSGSTIEGELANQIEAGKRPSKTGFGLAAKQLIGIPWRVALALRADGWYLRQDIIWHKPNPMPESVRDRCTKAHEYIFLLSKSPRYYFDIDAIKEPSVKGHAGSVFHVGKTAKHQLGRSSEAERVDDGLRNPRSVWTIATRGFKGAHFATFPPTLIKPCVLAGCPAGGGIILDPFMGSGTTAAVAIAEGRRYLGCELNPQYKTLQDERLTKTRRTSFI